jgi:hypothetical protein
MKISTTIAVIFFGVGSALPSLASAQSVSPVQFARGATSTTLNGSIRGYQFRDYSLSVRAGQMLSVSLRRVGGSPYFNVLAPGSKDVAIFIGSTNGNQWEGQAQHSGDYTVRVYQMRAAARRGEIASYRLTLAATGSGDSDALVPGTHYHASAQVRCKVTPGPGGTCKAGVIRRGNGSATIHLDTYDGGQRTILFRDGNAVSSDASTPIRVERRGDTSVVHIGSIESYEIPDALPFGG